MPVALVTMDRWSGPAPRWPTWAVVVVILAMGAFLVFAFHAVRGAGVIGLDARGARAAAVGSLVLVLATGAWAERGRRAA